MGLLERFSLTGMAYTEVLTPVRGSGASHGTLPWCSGCIGYDQVLGSDRMMPRLRCLLSHADGSRMSSDNSVSLGSYIIYAHHRFSMTGAEQ